MPTLKYRMYVNISGILHGWEEIYVDRSIWTVYYLRKHFCAQNLKSDNMQKPRKSNINQWISMMIAYRAYRPIIFRESHLK